MISAETNDSRLLAQTSTTIIIIVYINSQTPGEHSIFSLATFPPSKRKSARVRSQRDENRTVSRQEKPKVETPPRANMAAPGKWRAASAVSSWDASRVLRVLILLSSNVLALWFLFIFSFAYDFLLVYYPFYDLHLMLCYSFKFSFSCSYLF